MFTVAQIGQIHNKVKSGADFPGYIREIKQLGVTGFETWVTDCHTVYFGENGFQAASAPKYDNLLIANTADKEKFSHYLKIHQQGQTDYYTFCTHCAQTGIEKWVASLDKMTCIYYDKKGNEVLAEQIPG